MLLSKDLHQEMTVQELLIYGDSGNQSHETHKSAIMTILGTFCKNLTVKAKEKN